MTKFSLIKMNPFYLFCTAFILIVLALNSIGISEAAGGRQGQRGSRGQSRTEAKFERQGRSHSTESTQTKLNRLQESREKLISAAAISGKMSLVALTLLAAGLGLKYGIHMELDAPSLGMLKTFGGVAGLGGLASGAFALKMPSKRTLQNLELHLVTMKRLELSRAQRRRFRRSNRSRFTFEDSKPDRPLFEESKGDDGNDMSDILKKGGALLTAISLMGGA